MIKILGITLKNDMRYMLRYPMGWLVPFVSIAIFFISILSIFPSGAYNLNLRINIFAAYMTFMLYTNICQGTTSSLSGKAAQGLLEREFVSPIDHLGVTTIGLASEVILQIPFLLINSVILAGIAFHRPWLGMWILPLVLTAIVFLVGISFVFLGVDLLWKRTTIIFQPLQFIMMILAFATIQSHWPVWRWLPYTAFGQNLAGVLNGKSSFQVMGDWRPILVSCLSVVCGIVVFKICDKKAMERGTISHF